MHIIIPMSGIGARFLKAGYTLPKPLIVVDGEPIIKHVIDLFPGETKFTFICNAEHLQTTPMRKILLDIVPHAKIVSIEPHKKGPVFAVLQAQDLIDDDEEVIVNYCDFSTYWNYADFLSHTRNRSAAGAIPAYKGFHPHMLGTTNYAFIKDSEQWLEEIKEKEPFTSNRMQEYASNGTYYFARGSYVKKYFQEAMDQNLDVNGEFYVSVIYNLLVRDGLPVSIYDVQHMLQWGTPEDVAEYRSWSNYFARLVAPTSPTPAPEKNSLTLVPLAGRGKRFSDEGYDLPKPLIPVSGRPMIVQATEALPASEQHTFVCLEDHLQHSPLRKDLLTAYPKANIIGISHVTEGQACTCVIGLEGVSDDTSLSIGACDNSMIYDTAAFEKLQARHDVDAIIWTFTNQPSALRSPHMYGWIKADESGKAVEVGVKKVVSETPEKDHTIVGAFYFKKAAHFKAGLAKLYEKNVRVNGEFYVDSLCGEVIELGLNVYVFDVDFYVCWGTPNDLRTFNYWQSFFHKCAWHPYTIEKDAMVPDDQKQVLITTTATPPQQHSGYHPTARTFDLQGHQSTP